MSRDAVGTLIGVGFVLAYFIVLAITKPTCRPGEYAALPRHGDWVCARTP